MSAQLPPRKTAPPPPAQLPPRKTDPPENCPLTKKFPWKITNPTQANSPQRVLRVNWGKLCIIYQYYNIQVLQHRSKKWFTSINFLQILTKPCRITLIREHLLLNASWFSYARTQKIQFFGKTDSEKNTKKLHSQ